MKIEHQKQLLEGAVRNGEPWVDEETAALLKALEIGGFTVLDIGGGVGMISEYLSRYNNTVTLIESEGLAFSYRRNILKDSNVKAINISPREVNWSTKFFDYVIIRDLSLFDRAKSMAKLGVINLVTGTIDVMHDDKEYGTVSTDGGINESKTSSFTIHTRNSKTSNEDSGGFTMYPTSS